MSSTPSPLTYSELPTINQWINCGLPYSFYFDFVESFWKAPYVPISLHRLCTLARKQGATHVIVESGHGRTDIVEELTELDRACGTGGAAEAVKISFIDAVDANDDPSRLTNENIIGQAVLINYKKPSEPDFSCSYMFEAIFRPPLINTSGGQKERLLNNLISTERNFQIDILGRPFEIPAVYYCQQNSITHACAQSCLRMAINTMPHSGALVSGATINNAVSPSAPGSGLNLGQIQQYITSTGKGHPLILSLNGMRADDYLSVIDSYVQSGLPTLLIFSTASQPNQAAQQHVVSIVGCTRNSDEWHPQAIPAYAGPSSASYRKSSLWTDHFVIHDDNFGPYYTLSSRALEVDPNVTAQVVIAVSPVVITHSSIAAEAIAAIGLSNLMPALRSVVSNRWFDYISSNNYQFVMRPILIKRDDYFAHLQGASAHDGSAITASETAKIINLPDYFWMVEFSMPSLFMGNHTKLGEVLINPSDPINPHNIFTSIYYVRLPGVLFSIDKNGKGLTRPFPMTSHISAFQIRPLSNRW